MAEIKKKLSEIPCVTSLVIGVEVITKRGYTINETILLSQILLVSSEIVVKRSLDIVFLYPSADIQKVVEKINSIIDYMENINKI